MDNVLDGGKQEIEPYSVGLRCCPMRSFDYVSLASTIKWTFLVVMKWMQSVLISAFVGIALAFACFSVAAMLAHRREYIYLGGILSSGVSMLMWLHFASIFGGTAAIFKFKHQERRDEEDTTGTFGREGLTKQFEEICSDEEIMSQTSIISPFVHLNNATKMYQCCVLICIVVALRPKSR